MDLLDRLLGHDAWTTGRLLEICEQLGEEDLDREFDIGHRTIRQTLDHIIHNMEVWSCLMSELPFEREKDDSVAGLMRRLSVAEKRLSTIARNVASADAWDELWYDKLDDPPRHKAYGTAIAHVITHSMHHRSQLLYMFRLAGVAGVPEGDVFSWESEAARELER